LLRLLSRVLVVLGGTITLGAIGWLCSSATAAADTVPVTPPSVVGVVLDSVGMPARSATVPAVATPPAAPTSGTSSSLPLPGADGVHGVTRALDSTLRQLGDHVSLDRTVVAPPLTTLPSTKAPVSTQVGQSGPAGGPTSTRAPRAQVVATTRPTPAGAVVARHSQVRPPAGPLPPTPPALPAMSTSPAPWSPLTGPAGPDGAVGNPGGVGGPGFVDDSGTFAVPGLDIDRVVPTTDVLGHGTPGRQPGSTPD
jgi:hypothetical protein